jgi:hypothetical protein
MTTATVATSSNIIANTVVTSFADIHNSLIAVGLVQTSDTGQMTFPYTAPVSLSNNVLLGYTVYRFNDSYQTSYPIFIRIEWRTSQPGNASKLAYNILVGSSSNGSGTITGSQLSTNVWNTGLYSGAGNATTNTYISFSNGNLNIAITPFNQPTNLNSWYFGISRIIDSTGTIKNGYWYTSSRGADTSNNTERIYTDLRTTMGSFTHGVSTAGAPIQAPFLWSSELSSIQVGEDLPYFPPVVIDPLYKSTLGFIYTTTDIGSDMNFNVIRYGTAHTYKSLGSATNLGIQQPLNLPSRYGFSMLWE